MTAREVRQEAMRRFKAHPEKTFQKHMQDVWGEVEPRTSKIRLKRCRVERVPNSWASTLIERYEYLGSMASGTIVCYGLLCGSELLGVECFSKGASVEALLAVHTDANKVIILARGCCKPHLPPEAPSFLISRAIKQAHWDFGWTHFIGYADPAAGEQGNVYRASSWTCIGTAEQGTKCSFTSPDGMQRISSYEFNHKSDPMFYAIGWDGEMPKYQFLREQGWTQHEDSMKVRWLKVLKDSREKNRQYLLGSTITRPTHGK